MKFYEYIESTGKQWIDSGVNPKIKPRVVANFAFLNTDDKDFFGNGRIKNNIPSAFWANFSNLILRYYRYGTEDVQPITSTPTLSLNDYHVWDLSNEVYLDGVLYYTAPTTYTYDSTQSNIYIFAASHNFANCATYRLKYMKIYDGDELKRFFIPAGNGTEYGLYDILHGTFYKDISGKKVPFKVGAEISCPYKIMTRTKNLFGGTYADMQLNTSNGPYGFWGPLPNGTYNVSISLKDKNNPTIYDTYFGVTQTGYSAINFLCWLLKNGSLTTAASGFTFTASDSAPKYLSIFRIREQDVVEFFEKYNVMLNTGSTAEPYIPYMAEVKKMYKGDKLVYKANKEIINVDSDLLTLNFGEVNNNILTLPNTKTVNNNTLILK